MSDICPFDVTPLAKSKNVRNNVFPNLQYTHQDYSSIFNRMLDLARQKYGKYFNEFQESSLAVMLLDLWAFLGDQLSFKIDQIANEIYIDTVTEMPNAMRLAKFVGFRPIPPLSSKAMFTIELNHPLSSDLPLQTPLPVAFIASDGSGEKTFELFAADTNGNPIYGLPIVIPATKIHTDQVVGIEGRSHTQSFNGTGEPYQYTTLTAKNVLFGSIKVKVDGVYWTEVEYFTDSQARKEFRVEYDKFWRGTIHFGDNESGLIPPNGCSIAVNYRTGGGVFGNVITGAVNKSINIQVPDLGYVVSCQVSNYTKGMGGYEGDTIEDIRRKLPIYLKTQGRAVTGFDYKALVENFASSTNGNVGKAIAVLRQSGCAANIIDIFLLARDGYQGLAKANSGLKAELVEDLIKRKMFTDTICLRDGEVIEIDIQMTCILDRVYRNQEINIRERVLRRLANFFSINNWEFGQSLRDTDLIKSIADIKEIEHMDVMFTSENSIEKGHGSVNIITAKFYEIIRPDNIRLDFSYKS